MDFIRKALYILFFVFLLIPQTYSQSVGLVLSGGGAKGMTHIGLIRALEENNIPIDYITGTSMGYHRFSLRYGIFSGRYGGTFSIRRI